MNDCVATAPTPASAHETPDPTENACDWTATPSSPVAGSRATIEYVWTGRRGTGALALASVARRVEASARRTSEPAAKRRMGTPFWRHDTSGIPSLTRCEIAGVRGAPTPSSRAQRGIPNFFPLSRRDSTTGGRPPAVENVARSAAIRVGVRGDTILPPSWRFRCCAVSRQP